MSIAALTSGSRVAIVVGAIGAALGILTWFQFSPSPHGYLETWVSVPLFAAGALIIGAGLAAAWLRIGWLLRLVAAGFVVLSLWMLGSWVWFVA